MGNKVGRRANEPSEICSECGAHLSEERAQWFRPVADVENGPHPSDADEVTAICEACEHKAMEQALDKLIVRGPIDGNAFAVMGAVARALRRAGQADKVKEYRAKATSGDYNNLLRVSMEYVDFDLVGDECEDSDGR